MSTVDITHDASEHKEELQRSRMAAVRLFCQIGELLDVDCTQEFYLLSLVKHANETLNWDEAKLQVYKPIVLNAVAQRESGQASNSQNAQQLDVFGSGNHSESTRDSVNGESGHMSVTYPSDSTSSGLQWQLPRGLDPEATNQINRVLWFRATIINERRRILATRHGTPPASTPWVQLSTNDGRPFYYCFTDGAVADCLPGLSDGRSSLGTDTKSAGLAGGFLAPGSRSGEHAGNANSLLHSLEECDLEIMTFTTMWTEGNTRRKATIRFHILSGCLEIKIDGAPNLYRITAPRRMDGQVALSCWDLHVKGRIKCLGRTVTLLSCDQKTNDWISGNAWRLIKAVDRLEAALEKHESVPPGPPRPTLSQHGIPSKPLNEVNLRQLMNRAALLRQLLARHRPAYVSMMEG